MSQHRGRRMFAVLALAALATGCGGGSEKLENVAATETPGMGTTSPGMTPPGMQSPGHEGTATPGSVADIKRVGEAALKAVPNGTIVKMDAADQGKMWDVTVAGEDGALQSMKIDAQSGQVKGSPKPEEGGDKAKTQELVQKAKIDYAQAAEKMLSQAPGGHLTKLELDDADGKAVWKGEVADEQGEKREMRVDAETGEVMSTPGASPGGEESPGGPEQSPEGTPEETMVPTPEEPGASPS
ncbi:PepSY domain-containing protein [Thermopolyspora sp. NPDC052614]|uniref:PepSY domain-containing protein n=1 Tax=Thermopolyspora sp. NPDC052614 TaxID=3155682 RepID=UPI00342E9ED9